MSPNGASPIRLLRQVRLLRVSLGAAVLLSAVLAVLLGRAHVALNDSSAATIFIQATAPHSGIVEKVIQPLRYSGYPDFIRPEVSLDMDFEGGKWALLNIHRFDPQGNLLLNEGRYGICGDLAIYTYQKILPHFPPEKYRIEFAKVVESSFFQEATGGFHFVLRIVDLEAGRTAEGEYRKVYILDPALRRYGSPEYFDSYKPIGPAPLLDSLEARERHSYFAVDTGPPILVNRNVILSLYVVREEGRFDPDHYAVVLAATRRYHFVQKDLFVIRKRGGKLTVEEKDSPIKKLIQRRPYDQLKKSLLRLHAEFERARLSQMRK